MARLPAAGLLHVVMSEVLLERNDLEAAEAQLSRGAELGRWSGRLDAVRNAARRWCAWGPRQDANWAAAVQKRRWASRHPLARAELLALKATVLVRQGP